MSARKVYRRVLICIFCIGIIFFGFFANYTLNRYIPDEISVLEGDYPKFNGNLFMKYSRKDTGLETAKTTPQVPVDENQYEMCAELFGLFHYKDITVHVIPNEKLIPCGTHVGIYLQTNGVLIIGTSPIKGQDGMEYAPAKHLVKADDYIVSLNQIQVSSKSQLIFLINKYGADEIVLGIRRNQDEIQVRVRPVAVTNGEYKLGIWVRDDMQGIGTMTYVKENGEFGALGHGISDIDTGVLLSSEDGILYNADIWGIEKGQSGDPGGLLGSIEYEKSNVIGKIEQNHAYGIYGVLNQEEINDKFHEAVPIGLKQDVKKGKATILCALQDETEIGEYEIEIEQVDLSGKNQNKGMVIRITDDALLKQTNGIVQGMSGSPIIQNGRIVGAVTHVLVNDPSRGYGIFIENMLEH